MATLINSNAHTTFDKDRHMAVPCEEERDNTDGKYDSSEPDTSQPSSSSHTNLDDLKQILSDPATNLCREVDRRRTLQYIPGNTPIDKDKAAKNGFYYFGIGDTIKCNFCKVELSQWAEGDDIEVDHGRWSPKCPFLLGKPVGNVPSSRDECGFMDSSLFKPAYSSYRTEPARLATFKFWPPSLRPTPQDLAAAGFYYSGVDDQTICYYCGGGLKDWEEDDDPWEQHALWFQKCPYLINIKGTEFIKSVKTKYSQPTPTALNVPATPQSVQQMDARGQQPAPSSDQPRPSRDSTAVQEERICSICYDQERNACFVPCGHVVACVKCAMSVTLCPVCRQPYTKFVKLYFS